MEVARNCRECGDIFLGENWQTYCKKCYWKLNYPESYEKQQFQDITCKRCGKSFVGEGWKDLCIGCYFEQKEEDKILDLEERMQYK